MVRPKKVFSLHRDKSDTVWMEYILEVETGAAIDNNGVVKVIAVY